MIYVLGPRFWDDLFPVPCRDPDFTSALLSALASEASFANVVRLFRSLGKKEDPELGLNYPGLLFRNLNEVTIHQKPYCIT